MEKPLYKQLSFWIALVMTNVGLLLTNNVIGDGDVVKVMGWLLTIATVLGYKALPVSKPEAPTA